MADSGRRKEEKPRDGGALGGTYRPESTWARGVVSGEGWFGPGWLDGGLAGRAAALRMAGRRGGSGERLGRVLAWGGAKGQARWRWRGSPGPFGHGSTVDEVHRLRTAGGGRNRAPGGERWR